MNVNIFKAYHWIFYPILEMIEFRIIKQTHDGHEAALSE